MIRELHDQLVRKEISAQALTEKYLATIEAKDPEIGAFLSVHKEGALREAAKVDAQLKRGEEIDLLSGIPGAIKDNICMAEEVTTAASKMLDNYRAPYDATVIKRLKECQAIVVGKTNMDEFAMGSSTENSAYQKTKNPHDLNRVPGGSSGGSAAAVAAHMAVWALGSDTGGSIRQPAALCGMVGFKPTYGRVSRSGLIAMVSSLDQIGPLTHSVEDAAIVFSRIMGEDDLDATTASGGAGKDFEQYLTGNIQGLKIGIPKEYFPSDLPPAIRQLTDQALERFRALGAVTEEISLPHTEYALPVYYILMPSEVSSNMARYDGIKYGLSMNDQSPAVGVRETSALLETYLDTRRHGLGTEVKRRIMLGTHSLSSGYYDAYFLKAQKVRALIKQDFVEAFKKVNLIFTPTTPEPAFRFGEKTADPLKMYLSDIYTVTANLAGIPGISFPIGTMEMEGKALPIGGQLFGKWFDEETLLCAADAFERQMTNNS